MQFYIVHPDPEKSAEMLPDYALKQVNLREGFQILSDIAHIHGVTWPEQNACYSRSHALTRKLSSSRERFQRFLENYNACLTEYERRWGKCSWVDKYFEFLGAGADTAISRKLPADEYEDTRRYLLTEKRDKLTEAEAKRLSEPVL